MTFGTIALLAGLLGGPPCCDAAPPGPAEAVEAVAAALTPQDPVKPKSRERPAREPERRQADPPKAEPTREPRRDPPKAAPSGRGTQREPERPKSTGEPELRRRKP
jgi:hypothetical protein